MKGFSGAPTYPHPTCQLEMEALGISCGRSPKGGTKVLSKSRGALENGGRDMRKSWQGQGGRHDGGIGLQGLCWAPQDLRVGVWEGT